LAVTILKEYLCKCVCIVQVQPNNYVSFYDDTRQSWSLMFESESVLTQFAKQVI